MIASGFYWKWELYLTHALSCLLSWSPYVLKEVSWEMLVFFWQFFSLFSFSVSIPGSKGSHSFLSSLRTPNPLNRYVSLVNEVESPLYLGKMMPSEAVVPKIQARAMNFYIRPFWCAYKIILRQKSPYVATWTPLLWRNENWQSNYVYRIIV